MKDTGLINITEEDFINYEERKRASLINSLSGFKSANLLGTISSDKKTNLSIVSSTFHLGASPALMGIIIRPDISPRHTLENIRSEKFFTLNHVNEHIYKKAHQTSARYPREMSEFDSCNLTEEYLEEFHAPFVKESNIKVALKLIREIKIEENGTHFLISSVKSIWAPESALSEDGHINIENAQSICVSGLDSYHSTSIIERLPYAKP
ncbi:flavin oxidoreductase [Halobacteriovorax marinus]|uniref:flavin reductase family protein n=1 Tax=Halobacteriovorax marinus TaxID=97084 RepID=UPI000BC30F8D|nr:flavin reductase [Halobacteriovorax marinus]ATH08705.1 flavin oxidoreductase [Halobacteriovorax marinus]